MENLIQVYKCFCDETRLRILHLLSISPLCVCHLQHILGISQVNTSRHLGILKQAGMVTTTRHQNWIIYAIPGKPTAELEKNLACLQDLAPTEPIFTQDRKALTKLLRTQDVRQVLSEGGCLIPTPEKETSS
jgi:ArsR family transcriptional regulator